MNPAYQKSTFERITKACIAESIPIQKLSSILNIAYQTVYHAVRRGEKKGHFKTQKIDGIIWVRALKQGNDIDLIKDLQNSNNFAKGLIFDTPQRCAEERRVCIKKAQQHINIKPIKNYCQTVFADYLGRINSSQIVLAPNPERDFLGEPLYLDYRTRFNDMGRKVEQLKKYEQCWDVATTKHKSAVFVTLTTDPKLQNSLWDANRKISKNLNKFLSFMARRKGTRPEYINTIEYQKNGRAHLHIVLFGMAWVMDKEELSKLWKKYGQGEIIDFLGIKNDGSGWTWKRQKPKHDQGETPQEYLAKYLKKGLWDGEKLFQYWIYNNRFFTYSRKLCIFISYKVSNHWYVFIGIVQGIDERETLLFNSDDPPDKEALELIKNLAKSDNLEAKP